MTERAAIGVFAPSAPLEDLHPGHMRIGMERFDAIGWDVVIHSTGRTGHTAGSVRQRVEALRQLIADPRVQVLLPVFGGYNTIDLLDDLPWSDLLEHRPTLCGFSDATMLLISFATRGLRAVHGPNFASLCEPDLHPYTWQSFVDTVLEGGPGVARDSDVFADGDWWVSEGPVHYSPAAWRCWGAGVRTGMVVGGNADTLLALAGSPDFPELDDRLLILEHDIGVKPGRVDRDFAQLGRLGAWSRVAGLILGRPTLESEAWMKPILAKHLSGMDAPVLWNVTCGHGRPMCSVPMDRPVQLDAGARVLSWS